MNNNKIGMNIKKYRKGKFTQQELADRIGKTESSIRKYEKGLVTIPLDVLKEMATVLEVTVADLMGFDEEAVRKEISQLDAIENYFKILGFSLKHDVTKWHWEDDAKEVQIVDEVEYILTKDNHSTTFTQEEFNELQAGTKELIEGKFYKKLVQSK